MFMCIFGHNTFIEISTIEFTDECNCVSDTMTPTF